MKDERKANNGKEECVTLIHNGQKTEVTGVFTYHSLETKIAKEFNLMPDSFSLHYYDEDNDFIIMASEDDLEEAKNTNNGAIPPISIKVKPSDSLSMSIIGRPYEQIDLTQSVASHNDMSELVSNIKEKKQEDNLKLQKAVSGRSIEGSDAYSVFDYDAYEKELEEGDQMINEFSRFFEKISTEKELENKRSHSSQFKPKEDLKKEEPKKEVAEEEIQADVPVKEKEEKQKPVIPNEILEEIKALGIQQAKEFELMYLKQHIENIHRDAVHKDISCSY